MANYYPHIQKYPDFLKVKNFMFQIDIGEYDDKYNKFSNEFIDVIYYKFKGKEYFYGVIYKYKKDYIVNNDTDVFVKNKYLKKKNEIS